MNHLQHKFWNLTIPVVDHCNFRCIDCIHFAPYRAKKEHYASDYIPSIQTLLREGILTNQELLLAGGEPFIHSDLIGFVAELREAIPSLPIVIATNGGWLSDRNVEKYEPVFRMIHRMTITQYQKLNLDPVPKIRQWTKVVVRPRYEFAQPSFSSEWKEPVIPDIAKAEGGYCRFVDCIQLTHDGRLMKCPAGYVADAKFPSTPQFNSSIEMYYDIANPKEPFQTWWERYPFDACYYCRLDVRPHQFIHKLA